MINSGDYIYCYKEMVSIVKRTSELNYPILFKKGNSYRVECIVYLPSGKQAVTVINERGNKQYIHLVGEYKMDDYFTHIGKVELMDTNKVFNELQ